jgi:predicted transcriptional regulator
MLGVLVVRGWHFKDREDLDTLLVNSRIAVRVHSKLCAGIAQFFNRFKQPLGTCCIPYRHLHGNFRYVHNIAHDHLFGFRLLKQLDYFVFYRILMEYSNRRWFMKTTTVRIDDDLLGRIDCLANTLSRSRSWVINQAIEKFVGFEEWFVQEVEDGLKEIEQGRIATDDEVTAGFRKWGVDAS